MAAGNGDGTGLKQQIKFDQIHIKLHAIVHNIKSYRILACKCVYACSGMHVTQLPNERYLSIINTMNMFELFYINL